MALLIAMANDPAPRVRDVAPHVSLRVARIIDRAIEFRREDRYPTATAMRADVQAALRAMQADSKEDSLDPVRPSDRTIRAVSRDLGIDADGEAGSEKRPHGARGHGGADEPLSLEPRSRKRSWMTPLGVIAVLAVTFGTYVFRGAIVERVPPALGAAQLFGGATSASASSAAVTSRGAEADPRNDAVAADAHDAGSRTTKPSPVRSHVSTSPRKTPAKPSLPKKQRH
jgi:hypothetical protein